MAEAEKQCIWLRECNKDTQDEVKGQVKGTIPSWLEGRVTRNGPGTLHVGETQYHHLFDALAMLHQFNISSGQVTYRSRFLKSEAYQKNMAANRIVMTEFGTAAYPDPCSTLFEQFKNTLTIPTPDKVMSDNCSINVCQVKDEMFALTESCFIRQIDPETLKTVGNKINITKCVAVNMATAHPHIDTDGTVYNLGSSFTNLTGPCYSVVKLPMGQYKDAKVVASIPAHRKLEPSYYHSFAMTDNYWVFVEQPLVMRLGKMITGSIVNKCPAEAMTWLSEEDAYFRVVERSSGRVLPVSYKADGFCTFHHINAWEEDGQIVMDLCGSAQGNIIDVMWLRNLEKSSEDPSRLQLNPNLWRFVLPLDGIKEAKTGDNLVKKGNTTCTAIKQKNGSVHCTYQTIMPELFDLPRINYKRNGKSYQYVYGLTTKEKTLHFDTLVKINVKTGETLRFGETGYVAGEPIFVPSPGAREEDDGVILSTFLKKADPLYVALFVLNAKDLKEMARVEFKAKGEVTSAFHGQYVGTRDNIHSY